MASAEGTHAATKCLFQLRFIPRKHGMCSVRHCLPPHKTQALSRMSCLTDRNNQIHYTHTDTHTHMHTHTHKHIRRGTHIGPIRLALSTPLRPSDRQRRLSILQLCRCCFYSFFQSEFSPQFNPVFPKWWVRSATRWSVMPWWLGRRKLKQQGYIEWAWRGRVCAEVTCDMGVERGSSVLGAVSLCPDWTGLLNSSRAPSDLSPDERC